MYKKFDVDSNSVASNSGEPMDNTDVDMTKGAPHVSSDEAGSQAPGPNADPVDADSDTKSE